MCSFINTLVRKIFTCVLPSSTLPNMNELREGSVCFFFNPPNGGAYNHERTDEVISKTLALIIMLILPSSI